MRPGIFAVAAIILGCGSAEPEPCNNSTDCDNDDPCTFAICTSGECKHPNEPDGTPCGPLLKFACVSGKCPAN